MSEALRLCCIFWQCVARNMVDLDLLSFFAFWGMYEFMIQEIHSDLCLLQLLAKKVIAIMELSQRQLSKQDHYDYGLRSFVIPIARAAGSMKRVEPDLPEDVILQRAMRDLIKPKLIFADLPLFNALLSDLFPGVELAPKEADNLKRAIEHQLRLAGMQIVPAYITKIIQVQRHYSSVSIYVHRSGSRFYSHSRIFLV